jgi:hypothetical protein
LNLRRREKEELLLRRTRLKFSTQALRGTLIRQVGFKKEIKIFFFSENLSFIYFFY